MEPDEGDKKDGRKAGRVDYRYKIRISDVEKERETVS